MENVVMPDNGELHSSPGKNASWPDAAGSLPSIGEYASLVYILSSVECEPALLQATRRIRQHIRQSDVLMYLEHVCIIGLPATPLQGAQSVARRIMTLLVDIDCEIQTFYGLSALALWQRLLSQHALVVNVAEPSIELPRALPTLKQDAGNRPLSSLPYLACLASYPSRRLLQLFPYELACRYHCVPVGAERDMLTIGTLQRLDEPAVQHMRDVTGRRIFQVCCEASLIEGVLQYWRSAQTVLPGLM